MCRMQCVLVIVLLIGLVQAWDIAVTVGDRIEFYTINGTKTDTVRFNSQNLTEITYDEVHNMLLYVDKQSDNDTICGYNMTYLEYKCYIQRNGRNIQGLAFDPVTELLFFTDIKERSINWFLFKPGSENNVYGNLLIKMDDGIPTDLAVDSCKGYIYWINRYLTKSTIERARFDGSEREVVLINNEYSLEIHSLVFDQKAQKIYWKMPEPSSKTDAHVYSADFNGKNKRAEINFVYRSNYDIVAFDRPNSLIIFKQLLLSVSRCISCVPKEIYKFPKPFSNNNYKMILRIDTESVVGIAAKNKMKNQLQGISGCDHVFINYETNDSLKFAKEYEGPFCVHGVKDIGQSLCKCTPGYIGLRCDVSICENYCLQGNCAINEQGLPKCRCNAGYSGDRCELNVCHGYCSNNGTCSLNEDREPVCQCKGDYVGYRCEVSDCLNYCLQGSCSYTEQGLPICRCEAGYSGERCEVNICQSYCFNNGICLVNEEGQPVCKCVGEYEGEKCEVLVRLNNSDGSPNEEVEPACQCASRHEGSSVKDEQNKTISTTSRYYSAEKNLTLADLLANWQKPVATISVLVEVKTNN